MRISGVNGLNSTAPVSSTAETDVRESARGAATPAALQSEVLQPARAAMKAMPDIDHERVAELREALARGELPFDPSKLAGLIERFHGGRG